MKILLALSILVIAAGALTLVVYTWFLLLPEEPDPDIFPFEDMDPEAFQSLDNTRRARVLSETGHLPPSTVELHRPANHRASEDCQ
ncbi:hypothetical protein [Lysobacter sp. GCM10012299]|uniref:hypothetical protein n=1 Tax=Lysobacter sp. GCM10012299 TaxID=3317333 RepID=UPI003607F478